MPRSARPSNRKVYTDSRSVFLNLPYDREHEDLYIAYIVGLCCFGLLPRVTLALGDGHARLDKIVRLIEKCRYSIHDLSCVKLDEHRPATPRFNMPFELGIAVAVARLRPGTHKWFVFESKLRRLDKSLSDLRGSDAHIHGGKPRNVMSALCNAFTRRRQQPTVPEMLRVYRSVKRQLPELLRGAGTGDCFSARVFEDICALATQTAQALKL